MIIIFTLQHVDHTYFFLKIELFERNPQYREPLRYVVQRAMDIDCRCHAM